MQNEYVGAPDKCVNEKNLLLFQLEHMLWVLKKSVNETFCTQNTCLNCWIRK